MSETIRKMTSCWRVEADRCMHVFEIHGYTLQAVGLGVGAALRSATFAVGGHEWRISYYPNGDGHDDDQESSSGGYASVFLDLMAGNPITCPLGTKVKGSFSLHIINPITDKPIYSTGVYMNIVHTVLNPNETKSWGTSKFIKRRLLQKAAASSYLSSGDRLSIECYISINVAISLVVMPLQSDTDRETAEYEIRVPPPENNLLGRLLLGTKEGVDVKFEVQGVVFYAHKIVLAARSPVFKAELYGGFRGISSSSNNKNDDHNNLHLVTIQDMEPGVFKALLHFIYTDSLPLPADGDCDLDDEGVVEELLVAADRYAMDRMRLMCESMLCKRLAVESVADTLALADRHYCSKLKEACISFICRSRNKRRIKDVMGTQGYEHLKRACPSVVMNILEESVKSSLRR